MGDLVISASDPAVLSGPSNTPMPPPGGASDAAEAKPPMPQSPGTASNPRIHVILDAKAAIVATQAAAQQLDAIDGKLDGTYLGKPIVVAPNVQIVVQTPDSAASGGTPRYQLGPVSVAAVCEKAESPEPATGAPMGDGDATHATDSSEESKAWLKHHSASACPGAAPEPHQTRMLELVGLTPSIRAIDPRVGAYTVPLSHCAETVGRTDAQNGKRDVSICLLYQKGTCKAQKKCRQVHADQNFVTQLRDMQETNNDCCVRCGDVYSHLSEFNTLLDKYTGAFVVKARVPKTQVCVCAPPHVRHV